MKQKEPKEPTKRPKSYGRDAWSEGKKKDRPGCMAMGLMVVLAFVLALIISVGFSLLGFADNLPRLKFVVFPVSAFLSSWIVALLESQVSKNDGFDMKSLLVNTAVIFGLMIGVGALFFAVLFALCGNSSLR